MNNESIQLEFGNYTPNKPLNDRMNEWKFEAATKNDIKNFKYHRMWLESVIGDVWIVDRQSERDTIHCTHYIFYSTLYMVWMVKKWWNDKCQMWSR